MPYTTRKIRFGNKAIKFSNKMVNSTVFTMPEGLILLDYFKPGFRFGNISQDEIITQDFDDTSTDNLNYFNHSIFGNTFPTIKRDGTASDPYYYFYINELIDTDEFTVEYLIKYDGHAYDFGVSVHLVGGYTESDWMSYMAQFYHGARTGGNYRTSRSSYPWTGTYNCPYIPPASNVGKDNNCSSWKHIAMVKTKNNRIYWFMNGQKWYENSVISMDGFERFFIAVPPCVVNTNSWGSKYYGYNMTQLAVWNYAKYTEHFEVSRDLIVNQN